MNKIARAVALAGAAAIAMAPAAALAQDAGEPQADTQQQAGESQGGEAIVVLGERLEESTPEELAKYG